MNTWRRLQHFIPIIILIALLSLLARELLSAKPGQIPRSLLGKSSATPDFSLPDLFQPTRSFTPSDFAGRVVLLNVWASWCDSCYKEHAMLMKIKNEYNIPIFGIDYKDSPQAAINLLKKRGNPYERVGSDPNGDAAIELGIYGTPETFVINREGRIVYRHIGTINQYVWDDVLYPIIQQYQSAP